MILLYVIILFIFLVVIVRAIVLTRVVCKEIKDDVFIRKEVENENKE